MIQLSRSIRLFLIVVLVAGRTVSLAQSEADRGAIAASSTVTSIRNLHALDLEHARNAKVHITGTVTYYDPIEFLMFVQDDSGAIFVDTDRPFPVAYGDLVEIKGYSAPGYRTEVARDPVLNVIGKGKHYAGTHARYTDLVSGIYDCRLVKITGKVRAAQREEHERGSLVHLDVLMEGGEVQVYVGTATDIPSRTILGQTVEVTGVVGGTFDKSQRLTGIALYATTMSSIRTVRAAAERLETMPVSSFDEVFKTRNVQDRSSRVRVRGTLTYFHRGDAAVLETDGKAIYVQTRQTDELSLGDVVDAYGYASNQEYAPSLRLAALVPTGRHADVQPQRVTYDEALSGRYSDALVKISGVLMSVLPDTRTTAVVVNVDGHIVRTQLDGKMLFPELQQGSRLEITGICRITPGGPWREPYSFRLDMRQPEDIKVVSVASWWTVTHLISLLTALGLLGVAIATWALVLRRRVTQQTTLLERAMRIAHERSCVLEMLSSDRAMMEILDAVCESIRYLLPGTSCAVELVVGEALESNPETISELLSRTDLFDSEDCLVGSLIIRKARGFQQQSDRSEVCKTLADLAVLAVRQSTFHKSLLHHSTHDSLTDLPNRRHYERKLAATLQLAKREQLSFATINIDVNRFKQVNDQYGHETGDQYLIQISARLHQCMRGTDTLSRTGGDEFMALASPITTSDAAMLVQRLREVFAEPFHLGDVTIDGSASFGLAMYPQDGEVSEELKRHADNAMYTDKVRFAKGSANPSSITLLTPEELRIALNEDRCRLVYQPQFSSNGRLSGLEALLRVQDPLLGILPPNAFIDAVEQSDVIIEVGDWVLRQALRDALRWGLHRGEHVVMAVNVAPRQAQQADYADRVIRAIQEINYPPDRLELELVERSLAGQAGKLSEQLLKLRQAGVRISLDDFGAGESCLSMLHRLPVDTIKLDRGFFSPVKTEPGVTPILQAISTMARSLNKRVVAEGIELEEVMVNLPDELGMDYQGYLFSRPIEPEQISNVLASWRSGIQMPSMVGSGQSRSTLAKTS